MANTHLEVLRARLINKVSGLEVEHFPTRASSGDDFDGRDHRRIDDAVKELTELKGEFLTPYAPDVSGRIAASPDSMWAKGRSLRFFGLKEGDSRARVFEASLVDDEVKIKMPYFNRPNFMHVIEMLMQGGEEECIDYLYRTKAIWNGLKLPSQGAIEESGVPGFLAQLSFTHEGSAMEGTFMFPGYLGAYFDADATGEFKMDLSVYESEESFLVGFDLPGMPGWSIEKSDKVQTLQDAIEKISKSERSFFKTLTATSGVLIASKAHVPDGWYYTEFDYSGEHCPKLCAFEAFENLQQATMQLAILKGGGLVFMNFQRMMPSDEAEKA